MLIIKFLLTMLAGFAGHQTYAPTLRFGLRWGGMMRSAIGFSMALPCFLLNKTSIPEKRGDYFWDRVGRDTVAYLITGLFFGLGVFLGHLSDRHNRETGD